MKTYDVIYTKGLITDSMRITIDDDEGEEEIKEQFIENGGYGKIISIERYIPTKNNTPEDRILGNMV